MKTVWKVFHGSKEKGYKVAYLRIADNGALFGINGKSNEYIMLNRAEISDLLLTLEKVVYGAVLKADVKRIEEEEQRYREQKAKKTEGPLMGETFDLTE